MKLNLSNIPLHMHEGIQEYVDHGWRPGGFFYAVLCNDLVEAANKADDINKHCLFDYASLLYNDIPSAAWGSPKKVGTWVDQGGMDYYKGKE